MIWLAYAASRICLLLFLEPQLSDIGYYFEVASQSELGRYPYRNFSFEYPPLAFLPIYLPMLGLAPGADFLALPSAAQAYSALFRAEMLIADLLAFFFFLRIASLRFPERKTILGWGYLLCSTLLGHLLFDRLDTLFLLLLLLAIFAWYKAETNPEECAWSFLGGLALGASISLKWVSIFAAPFFLFAKWRKPRKSGVFWFLGLSLAIAIPFGIAFSFGENRVFDFLSYHFSRGLQIESPLASLAWLLQPLGWPVQLDHSFRSDNLVSATSTYLVVFSMLLGLPVLGTTAWRMWKRHAEQSRTEICRNALFALCAVTVFGKVLSPQYFLWILPVLLLAGGDLLSRNHLLLWAGAAVLIAGLTTWLFPYNYYGKGRLIPNLDFFAFTILAIRNLALVGVILDWWKQESGSGARFLPYKA